MQTITHLPQIFRSVSNGSGSIMSEIIELAGRCEAAISPDREMDTAIALKLGIVREREGNSFYGHKEHSVLVLERDYYDHGGHAPELPHYTGSIDAAMTLVPDGFAFGCGRGTDVASVEGWAWCGPDRGPYHFAASPALALCAAILKAKAS